MSDQTRDGLLATELPFVDPRTLLARHGFAPKKRFSQNFLVNRGIVERIADQVVRDEQGAWVIELGPGAGTLTQALLHKGAFVHAIEQDDDMLRLLRLEFGEQAGVFGEGRFGPTQHLLLQKGDAAEVALPRPDEVFADAAERTLPVLCGNLPYAITGLIFRNLFSQVVHRAVFMVQKEVADRLTAEPGTKAYGALTALMRARFRVRVPIKVSRGSFHPVPNVDSAVVLLEPLPTAVIDNTDAYEQTVRLAFGKRRKTLLNALADGYDKAIVRRALDAAHIDPMRRGETLEPAEFNRLAGALLDASRSEPTL